MSNAVRPRSTQAQFFHNWGAQAAMVMRLSVPMTRNGFWTGEKVDPGHCLFMNPEIPILEDALADMSACGVDGRNWQVPALIKQPHVCLVDPKPPSPDMFDSCRLWRLFAYDAGCTGD